MAKRVNRNSLDFKTRAARILPKIRQRAMREYGRRFLSEMGWTASRGFSGGFGSSRRTGVAGFGITQPGSASVPLGFSPDVADRVTNRSNATVSTILNQLNTLIKLADKIGVLTKDQQRSMLKQIQAARRSTREAPAAPIPEPAATGNANSLAAVDKTINDLISQFQKLTETVNDRVNEQKEDDDYTFFERFLDNLGLDVDLYRKERKTKQARRERTMRAPPDRTPIARPRPTPVAKPVLSQTMQNVSRNVTQSASRIAQGAAAGAGALKESIKRAAGPIVSASFGKLASRSIPVIGIGAAAYGAVDRLMKGDAVGAGLDMMSGVGGLATAVPLITASIVRDVYNNVFGIQPEQDPQFNERMTVVKQTVEEVVKDTLKDKVQPKSAPTANEVKKQLLPDKMPKSEADAKRQAAPPVAASAPPPAKAPAPSAAPGGKAPGGTPAGNKSGGGSIPGPKPESAKTQSAATMSPPKTSTGADIMTASNPPEAATQPVSGLGYNIDVGRFMPQNTSQVQIAAGRMGIGNVPNPDYIPSGENNLAALYNVMFFNLNYQSQ